MSTSVARPYAKAVFDLAIEHNTLDQWRDFLYSIEKVTEMQEMIQCIQSPLVSREDVLSVLTGALHIKDKSEYSEFLSLLIENQRMLAIGEIAKEFLRLERERESRIEAVVTSAFELGASNQKQLKTKLEQHFNKPVEMTYVVDASLGAGVIIRVGDSVIDGSLHSRLNQLKGYLKGNSLCN